MAHPQDRGRRIAGLIATLACASTLLVLLSRATLPQIPSPDQQLTVFGRDQNAYLLFAIANVLFGIFFTAFAAGFARFVQPKSPSIASAAAFLTAGSALVGAIFRVFYVDSLFSILDCPSTPTYSADATYLAAVAANFIDHVALVTDLVGAVGLLLFGWLVWKSGPFPNWLAYLLLAGGTFGILAQLMAIYGSGASIFLLLFRVLLAAWALASGVSLLLGKSKTARTPSVDSS
ncbi:MAG: DUF4386 family protein [Nitrososphaerota archaeon]|nr:DUF4386 family protein [Nitrososphaerota archaeon]